MTHYISRKVSLFSLLFNILPNGTATRRRWWWWKKIERNDVKLTAAAAAVTFKDCFCSSFKNEMKKKEKKMLKLQTRRISYNEIIFRRDDVPDDENKKNNKIWKLLPAN